MINCIYCNLNQFEEGKGSEEHVILSSLGGRKSSRNICCINCNNELGDEIDSKLSSELVFFTNLLNIKTGRKKSSKTIRNVGVMDGREFDLKPGGSPYFSKSEFEKNITEKGIEAYFSARNPEEALKMIQQFTSKQCKTPDDLIDAHIKIHSNYDMPQIDGTLRLGEPTFFRSIAKMMLTYLATLCDQRRLRNGSFDQCIGYIKGDKEAKIQISFDYNNEFPSSNRDLTMFHQVFVWADPKTGVVFSGISLFRFINVSCILTRSWSGGEIRKAHIIDPINSVSYDLDASFDEENPNILAENMGYDRSQFSNAIDNLMSETMRIQKETSNRKMIREAVSLAISSQNVEELNQDNINSIIQKILLYIAAQNCGGSISESLTLEQLKNLKL